MTRRLAAVRPVPRDLEELYAPIRDDLAAAEAALMEVLQAEAAPIGADVTALAGGGKRLRPAVTIAAARLGGTDDPRLPTLAALVEVVHLSSLVHDDILDEAPTRRGTPTLNALYGTPLAVLAGDLLYSTVFLRLLREMPLEVARTVTEGGRTMIEGEVRQNLAARRSDLAEDEYEALIGAKTAAFFAACARAGALLGKAAPRAVEAASTYGYRLGLAFQIVDDVLDWTADSRDLGKEVAADLRGGKRTLPLIRFAERDGLGLAARARDGGPADVAALLDAMRAAGVFDEAIEVARGHAAAARAALAPLPETPARRLLDRLAHFAVERSR